LSDRWGLALRVASSLCRPASTAEIAVPAHVPLADLLPALVGAVATEQRKLLTVAEAADALRISRTKLYDCSIGVPSPRFKSGRSRRISSEALSEFVARQTTHTPPGRKVTAVSR
jgi:excisionase family DNA binding protein